MKKWFIGLALLLVVIIVSAFIFIPSQLTVSNVSFIKASSYAVLRNLHNETEWNKWWPGEKSENKDSLRKHPSLNGYTYLITKKLYNAIELNIRSGKDVYAGTASIVPFSDSLAVQWEIKLLTGNNALKKILQYRQALQIKKDLAVILDSLKAFNENKARVYRFNIHQTTAEDTALVTTQVITPNYPSNTVIYGLINTLKKYIADSGAKETSFPMLNITRLRDSSYSVMTAIATEKSLKGKGNIYSKRFLTYKDKIVAADVKGGPVTIRQAYDEIALYINDYHLSYAVVPFEYLVTDRSKEADTSKWVTKIYVPIR